jgi:hypothetical protein
MPFTGGFSPSPERYGGGDGSTDAPTLQRVFESIAAARGEAYDQTVASFVGAENMAFARAITFDLFGANVRFANEMNPATATVQGNLPRWERILGQPPMPGDPQPVRQARCAAALLRFGIGNATQAVSDIVQPILGPLFVGLTLFSPSGANTWWAGLGGGVAGAPSYPFYPPCYVASVSGSLVTVAGLSSAPSNLANATLTLGNCNNPDNDGTYPIHSRVSTSSVVIVNHFGPSGPDYGGGGSSGSPTVSWSMASAATPFMSSVSQVDVLVNPKAVAGYVNANGTLNGKFFALANQVNPVLDQILPADVNYTWYINSSGGTIGFVLDDPNNLDCEAFGS